MLEQIEVVKPQDIEKRSFEILSEILGQRKFDPLHEPIIKRVIHTTADFEYADILNISPNAIESAIRITSYNVCYTKLLRWEKGIH